MIELLPCPRNEGIWRGKHENPTSTIVQVLCHSFAPLALEEDECLSGVPNDIMSKHRNGH